MEVTSGWHALASGATSGMPVVDEQGVFRRVAPLSFDVASRCGLCLEQDTAPGDCNSRSRRVDSASPRRAPRVDLPGLHL